MHWRKFKNPVETADLCPLSWGSRPPAVESSIVVEDAVENRGLYRVFVSRWFDIGSEKKRKQNVRRIVPGFGGGGFCLCVLFSPIRNDPQRTHKQLFDTRPVPGQSPKIVYVYVLSFRD